MRNITSVFLVTCALTLCAFTARAQCTQDIQCKGDRICQGGQCVDPPAAPQPQPAPVVVYPQTATPAPAPAAMVPAQSPSPPEPQWFEHGYGLVAFASQFHGWGGGHLDDDSGEYPREEFTTDSAFWGGVYLGAYLAPSENFQIGAFWSFYSGDLDAKSEQTDEYLLRIEMPVNDLGLSARAGGRVAQRVWIGGAVDLALMIAKGKLKGDSAETEPMFGVSLFPRLALDIMLVDTGSFKLAINSGLGALISPVYGGHPLDNASCGNLGNVKLTGWMVGPAMLLGLSFGG